MQKIKLWLTSASLLLFIGFMGLTQSRAQSTYRENAAAISSAEPTAPIRSAAQLMAAAKARARKEHKNIFVMFHASWCVWCKKMDASMQDPSCKDYFDKNFVIQHLMVREQDHGGNVHLNNPGAGEMLEKYAGGSSGIPFWLIFSADGQLLADSKLSVDGKNIGCPAIDPAVDAFIGVLKKTSKLSAQEAIAIKKRFNQNAVSF